MTVQSIAVNIPSTLYNQVQRIAQKLHRSVDDLLTEAATAIVPIIDSNDLELKRTLAQLAYLNDTALWQAARRTMSKEQRERTEMLNWQQQRSGLNVEEKAEQEALLKLYRETLLVRAQALALLKQRNYDVSDPTLLHSID